MIIDLFELTKPQKVLFYSVIISMIVQICCIYYMIDTKEKFKLCNCMGYIIFSTIAYLFYYKMVLP